MRKKFFTLLITLMFAGVVSYADNSGVKPRKVFGNKKTTETVEVQPQDRPAPINLSSSFLEKLQRNETQNVLEQYPDTRVVSQETQQKTVKKGSIVRPGLVGDKTELPSAENVPKKIAPIENVLPKENVLPVENVSPNSNILPNNDTLQSEDQSVDKDKKAKKAKKKSTIDENATDVDISSDLMEYYPENYELIATGNVVVTMLRDGTQLFADKMVYNTDQNTIKGYGNVKMIKDKSVIVGDFVNLNLNEENILIDKPSTEGNVYKVQAKEGYVYPGQIVTQNGSIAISDSANLVLASPGMGGVYYVPSDRTNNNNFYEKEEAGKQGKRNQIRAKVIHIKSMTDHDEVVVKNAAYYFDDKKLFSIPRIELTTNKAQDFIETNLPEMGSFRNYGSYFGPGFVANIPGGATLKLAPVFQIGRKSSDHDFGFGLLARLHSKRNITEAMWGTVDDMFILRGQYKLGQYTKFQYAHDAYMDEWFMGMRMPEYLFQLVHDRSYYLEDLDADFRNKFSAGYVSDYYRNNLGTMRFRWQTELSKVLWSKWNEDETMGINAGVIGQTSASLYGTGDFQGLVRGGPFVGTKLKNWEQTVAYFQGALAGHSPMVFDRYMYGKSNLTLRESLTLNKYIKVGYYGSLALLKDNWQEKLFQENQFYVMFGPEDFKFSIGYDPVRERLRFNYILTLRGDDIEVPYDKMIVDDAESLGKKKVKKKKKKKSEL